VSGMKKIAVILTGFSIVALSILTLNSCGNLGLVNLKNTIEELVIDANRGIVVTIDGKSLDTTGIIDTGYERFIYQEDNTQHFIVKIANYSDTPLFIANLSLTGSAFTVVETPPEVDGKVLVDPGLSVVMKVDLDPPGPGVFEASLSFDHNDPALANPFTADFNKSTLLSMAESRISCNGDFSLAVLNDGSIWTWGRNDNGQIGDGTYDPRFTPYRVSGIDDVVLARSGAHWNSNGRVLALLDDGTLRSWGDNGYGALGDGSTLNKRTPVEVVGLTGVVDVAVGEYHSLALTEEGTVYAWGSNSDGELGQIASVTASSIPILVPGLSGIVAIAAGTQHSVALKADGTLMVWGDNSGRQLGNGIGPDSFTPIAVQELPAGPAILSVDTSWNNTSVLLDDGSIWIWPNRAGFFSNDVSGTNSPDPDGYPSQVDQTTGLTNAVAMALGSSVATALNADGSVYQWGSIAISNGSSTTQTLPVEISGFPVGLNIISLSTGDKHAAALLENGALRTWGKNTYGQLGTGSPNAETTPMSPVSLFGVTAVDTRSQHALAALENGTVMSWGYNSYGQLGDGTLDNSYYPVTANNINNAVSVVTGWHHSLALLSDGGIMAWGENNDGQLGDGSTRDRRNPTRILNITGVQALDAGNDYSIALLQDGSVRAWGKNSNGQLGVDTGGEDSRVPVDASGITGVSAVIAGSDHVVALMNDATLMTWGGNFGGQLGDGTTVDKHVPIPITGLPVDVDVVAAAAGYAHTLVLLEDGSLWSWGRNNNGQVGTGTSGADITSPVAVDMSGITGAVERIEAGGCVSMAINTNGDIFAWGYIGGVFVTAPEPFNNISDVQYIAIGYSGNICAITNYGTVFSKGSNNVGQLGDGTTTGSSDFVTSGPLLLW